MARGRNRRAARREERQNRRADRRTSRNDRRMDRRGQRLDARQLRRETRQDARSERAGLRASARETAYENGIDPNAWVGESITGVANAAASFGSAVTAARNQPDPPTGGAGGGVNSLLDGLNKSKGPNDTEGGNGGLDIQKIAIPVGLGLLALKFLK